MNAAVDYDVAKLDRLVELLDRTQHGDTVSTSVRQPAALREALRLAVSMGMSESVNQATNQAVLERLEIFTRGLGLEVQFREHPEARPSLAEVAMSLAQMDENPLAQQPEIIEAAAGEVQKHWPDADGDNVLVWAQCLVQHGWLPASEKLSA
jgi:hypothetical protein